MTAVLPLAPATRCPPAVLPGEVLLGMPHLCPHGLSESWLLKELGHRHWMLLAQAAGQAVPDFRDRVGDPAYAAFCAVALRDARLDLACENGVLVIGSDIARVSRSRVASSHRLSIAGQPAGLVEMVSVFVKRLRPQSNHTIARVDLDELPPLALADRSRPQPGAPIGDPGQPRLARLVFQPCPSQDFNGAGLLYFTSFIAFVDRAEWQYAKRLAASTVTVGREVVFHGNLDPGEDIAVVLQDLRLEDDRFSHRCRIERVSDGALLAEVETVKRKV